MITYKTKVPLGSGLSSNAFVLDNKYIQLVGKRDDSYKIYKDMKANADLLNGKITCVDYPHNMILIEKSKEYPFGALVYPMVKGNPLNLDNVTEKQLENIAKKLVTFNEQMHNANIHWTREKSITHELEKIKRNIDILSNYLTPQEISALHQYHNEFSEYLNSKQNFCITHGDLWAENLIVDENNNLSGIIDFGNMSYFLPEVDYASLWDMTEGFMDKMIALSNEDITRKSVYLFILHREVCSFEYILDADPEDVNCQIEKIRQALKLNFN